MYWKDLIKIKKLCDRRDGKRVKDVNGMSHIIYHIKKSRNASEVYINKSLDVTELKKYYEKINKGKKKEDKITYFHLFCTAIGKVIFNRPYLNRFLVDGYYYDRYDVLISYVVKTAFNDDAQEVMRVIKIDEKDNVNTVSKKFSEAVTSARKADNNGADKLVETVGHMPKSLRGPIVGVFKFLDRHDLLPLSLTKDLLYYSTVIVSNLGSIGSKEAIYHNLTDFGTNSILITMGKIYDKEVIDEEGKKEIRSFCDFGITLDERIADGYYMIKSVEILEYLFKNPKLLEGNANDKIEEK